MNHNIFLKESNAKKYTLIVVLIILVIISAVLNPAFLKSANIMNIFRQIVPNGITACAMSLVILSGGIDLSAGSMYALSGVLFSLLVNKFTWITSILIVLSVAIALGGLVGLIITKLNIPPFIVTMAAQTIYRGVAMALTNASNISIDNKQFINILGTAGVTPAVTCVFLAVLLSLGLFVFYFKFRTDPLIHKRKEGIKLVLNALLFIYFIYMVYDVGFTNIQIIYYIIILTVTIYLLHMSTWGREIYAVGDNIKAAKMTGIKTDTVLIKVYLYSSFLAAVSGILLAAKLQSGVPSIGIGGEFDAITAVVIGGISLTGGSGKISFTIIGVLLIGIINNMFSLLKVSPDLQNILKGFIILAAVIIDMRFKKNE